MADPLASIIVLGWGGEAYIAACLAALQRQTCPALETALLQDRQVGQDRR